MKDVASVTDRATIIVRSASDTVAGTTCWRNCGVGLRLSLYSRK
jgi:hypothetical protein